MLRWLITFSIAALLWPGVQVCYAQSDTNRATRPEPGPVQIPGTNAPLSAPGTLLQSSPNPNVALPPPKSGRRRTQPPRDPRAFGVGIPLERTKAKRDTSRRR